MRRNFVVSPTRTVVRPGADCKFSLCGSQLGFELGKSVHVRKFSTELLFIQVHLALRTNLNHNPAVIMGFNQLGFNQWLDVIALTCV
jgi:hypothetical protein